MPPLMKAMKRRASILQGMYLTIHEDLKIN